MFTVLQKGLLCLFFSRSCSNWDVCGVLLLFMLLSLSGHSGCLSLSLRCGCRLNPIPVCPSIPLARPRLCPETGSARWPPSGRCSLRPEARGRQRVPLSRALRKGGKRELEKPLGQQVPLSLRNPPRANSATAFRRPCPSKSPRPELQIFQLFVWVEQQRNAERHVTNSFFSVGVDYRSTAPSSLTTNWSFPLS